MVTRRIRSEYMKKFKDPKWETYAKCYEELLKYRLTRRLLEQSHNPWFWGEWGSDTESSGRSTPLCRNKVEPLRVKDHTSPRSPKEPLEPPVPVAAEETTAAKQEAEIPVSSPVVDGLATEDAEPTQPEGEEETRGEVSPMVAPETDPVTQTKPKSKPRLSQKTPPPRPGPSTAKDAGKDARHPFALFGAGERDTEMASRKTHNVCPAASTKEIHESALRAKTRREVEKQMKRNDKRRAKSAELEKMKKTKTGPDYDPWMTEYMRCFSARSR